MMRLAHKYSIIVVYPCVSIYFYPARFDNHFLLGHHQGATTADWLRPWLATDINEYDKADIKAFIFMYKYLLFVYSSSCVAQLDIINSLLLSCNTV